MSRGTLMVASAFALGAAGLVAARHDEGHESVRTLAVREIAEALDGQQATATAVEVTLEPGQAGAQPHARVLGDDDGLAHTTQGAGPGQCHGRCERARPLVTGVREAGDDPPRRQGPRYPHRNLCP